MPSDAVSTSCRCQFSLWAATRIERHIRALPEAQKRSFHQKKETAQESVWSRTALPRQFECGPDHQQSRGHQTRPRARPCGAGDDRRKCRQEWIDRIVREAAEKQVQQHGQSADRNDERIAGPSRLAPRNIRESLCRNTQNSRIPYCRAGNRARSPLFRRLSQSGSASR